MITPSAWSMTARLTNAAPSCSANRCDWARIWALCTDTAAGRANISPIRTASDRNASLPWA
jgi:hypothetical protein